MSRSHKSFSFGRQPCYQCCADEPLRVRTPATSRYPIKSQQPVSEYLPNSRGIVGMCIAKARVFLTQPQTPDDTTQYQGCKPDFTAVRLLRSNRITLHSRHALPSESQCWRRCWHAHGGRTPVLALSFVLTTKLLQRALQ